MMAGKFKEYNWSDIIKLIHADAGLVSESDRLSRGQVWCVGGFAPPEKQLDTCIRVQAYDKPYSERIQEHAS